MTRTIPGLVDSIDKMMGSIALLAKEPVFHEGKQVSVTRDGIGKVYINPPKSLSLSPSLLRDFTCTVGCTACCLPITLDYTPEEFATFEWTDEIAAQAEEQFYVRVINVNGEDAEVATYEQFREPSCPYLRPTREGGALGCGFWTADNSTQPLECAKAPQLLVTTRGEGHHCLMSRPFGRGWAWQNKPQCEFSPILDNLREVPEEFDYSQYQMLLERYLHWSDHFGVETYIPEVLEVLPHLHEILREEGLHMVDVLSR